MKIYFVNHFSTFYLSLSMMVPLEATTKKETSKGFFNAICIAQ